MRFQITSLYKAINTFCLFKNIVSGCAAGNRSENIGRRLASQQGLESRTECARRDVLLSPYVNEKFPKKGDCLTKYIRWGKLLLLCKSNFMDKSIKAIGLKVYF